MQFFTIYCSDRKKVTYAVFGERRKAGMEEKRMDSLGMQAKAFMEDEQGVGVVEIILILVVLISLVILFKGQLTSLVTGILSKITSQSNSI